MRLVLDFLVGAGCLVCVGLVIALVALFPWLFFGVLVAVALPGVVYLGRDIRSGL